MEALLNLLVFAGIFYFMMRFGCGAHAVHGHGGHHDHEEEGHESHRSAGSKDPTVPGGRTDPAGGSR